MLLGLSKRYSGLLHCGTDIPSSPEVELLLHGARSPHPDRRHAQAAQQVSGQLGCEHDGRAGRHSVSGSWRAIVRVQAIWHASWLTALSFVTQPNMYARGILFGKMKYELGDHSFVRCPESGLAADLDFKTKGYFGGTYNAIGGFIKDTKTDKQLFELSGLWNEQMFIKDLAVRNSRAVCGLMLIRSDGQKRAPIRRHTCQRNAADSSPTGRAVRSRVAEAMAQGNASPKAKGT